MTSSLTYHISAGKTARANGTLALLAAFMALAVSPAFPQGNTSLTAPTDTAPMSASPVVVDPVGVPTLEIDDARARLDDGDEPWVFFRDRGTGRGRGCAARAGMTGRRCRMRRRARSAAGWPR